MDGFSLDVPAFREETFSPVAAIVRVKGPDEAITLAKDTEYALSSRPARERGRIVAQKACAASSKRLGAGRTPMRTLRETDDDIITIDSDGDSDDPLNPSTDVPED